MRIVTSGKKHKLVAEVLRVDKVRDVALLKLEEVPKGLKIAPLPLRLDKLTVSEDVYAVGVPLDYKILQDTVAKGIVSAHRLYKNDGIRMPFIQADVAIHGGNSGGMLLDEYGNVAGIAVMGLYMDDVQRSTDLNLFIPIAEALAALGITVGGQEAADYTAKIEEKEEDSPDEAYDVPVEAE